MQTNIPKATLAANSLEKAVSSWLAVILGLVVPLVTLLVCTGIKGTITTDTMLISANLHMVVLALIPLIAIRSGVDFQLRLNAWRHEALLGTIFWLSLTVQAMSWMTASLNNADKMELFVSKFSWQQCSIGVPCPVQGGVVNIPYLASLMRAEETLRNEIGTLNKILSYRTAAAETRPNNLEQLDGFIEPMNQLGKLKDSLQALTSPDYALFKAVVEEGGAVCFDRLEHCPALDLSQYKRKLAGQNPLSSAVVRAFGLTD
ncbi:MAG: hypothetical protein HY986_19655 [Candidatus Melainabacteria bacterium]|nr:hypothetical protein [Candidatus Melainabacteria bacterium]